MRFTLILFMVLSALEISAQGTLRGRITDENGESLIGVTVVFKENRASGAVSDFDGNFSLSIPDAEPHTIVISYISYATIEETLAIKDKEVVVRNFILKSASKAINEVQITAKAVKAKDYYIESIKRNSAITMDYISSETMKKTGDANVTSVIARVSGVSTNAGFITVRGVGDRYVKTSMNGSVIPTLDPFTNNIKLDIFPASLVDNIVITKTAAADIPGDWAGAYISVETKDYPEQLAINVETNFGYNNQSTFKNVLTSKRSKTDWLGYDTDLRDIDHTKYVAPVSVPTIYQELVALGLGDYFSNMGVNAANWGDGTTRGEMYFRLGLVQLGILPPSMIDDEDAVQAAKNIYETGSYKADAFKVLNAGVPGSGKMLSNNWNSVYRKAPVNFSQSFSIGNQFKAFGKEIGFIAGYRYGSSIQYDPDASAQRLRPDQVYGGYAVSSSLMQQSSKETNGWSALMNAAVKLSPNHSVGMLFMPNLNAVNNISNSVDTTEYLQNIRTKSQFYEQRRQIVYQLKSEHYIPSLKLKLESHGSYTRGKSSVPDFRNVQYYYNTQDQSYLIGGTIGNGIKRYFRYLTEDVIDAAISGEFPLDKRPGYSRKLKAGLAFQRLDRRYDQYEYSLNFGKFATVLTNDDLEDFFSHDNLELNTVIDNGIETATINHYYTESGSVANHTFGNSEIRSAYIMTDYAITGRLRISGGVRMEDANIFTDVVAFDSLGYEADDPRRAYSQSDPIANPGIVDELSILPSVNLVYKVRDLETAPLNLRLNYSKTLARPSIRELSDVSVFDYEFKANVIGNSKLKPVSIDNYDLRLENYFASGDDISFSVFAKNFRNHIELVNAGTLTWQNVDESFIYGIEMEGRKKILRNLIFRSNISLIKSETNYVRTRREIDGGAVLYIPVDTLSRPMYGQAPYVVNAMLDYVADSIGFSATVSYNVQGARLVIVSDNPFVPDVYELPRQMLDLKLSKKLGRHFNVSFTVKDVLASSVRRSYETDDKWTKDYDKYTYGTGYIFSLAYKL